jgi:membrane fusion protein (multidrug efflux system)
MNSIVFAMRRPITTLMLAVALASGGVLGLATTQPHQEHYKIVVTSPKATDVIITQQYVCQFHAQHHINVCALQNGYLEGISVKGGQAVKKGDSMFKIKAKAELNLTNIKAPFDGIVDRLHEQLGSLIKEGDILTTLSDNSVMWVYFNVPEKQYLEYMADRKQDQEDPKVELVLANGNKFPQRGKIGAIEAQFNNTNGNIAFRADFPNPDGLLRHGQAGAILIHRTLHDAIVIPQRATYEFLDKRYVYVVGKDDVVHQREIISQHEMDDIYVIKNGVGVGDRIVVEGILGVRDGEKVKYEFRSPEEVMGKLKNHADKIVVTSLKATDVIITQPYVCQIHAQRYIDVRALENGYLEEISVKGGQAVKKGDSMFKIKPAKAQAKANLTKAESNSTDLRAPSDAIALASSEVLIRELNFTDVRAPFDGIVDRLHEQLGSLIKEGDILTTLSDNSVMWVYFNVPENHYLEYMAARKQDQEDPKVELVLANGNKFPQRGKIGAIEAQFDNTNGNIPFRADFPNPDGLLRHGQTGTVLIHRTLHDATVIPIRAAYEIMDKRYVYVVDKDDVVHQREIISQLEMDDIYVIKNGVGVGDRIVVEGILQIHDGEKVEYEFRSPEEVMANQKDHVE